MALELACSGLIPKMTGRLRKTAVSGKKFSQNKIYPATRLFNL
jgi:hypothetical protein